MVFTSSIDFPSRHKQPSGKPNDKGQTNNMQSGVNCKYAKSPHSVLKIDDWISFRKALNGPFLDQIGEISDFQGLKPK